MKESILLKNKNKISMELQIQPDHITKMSIQSVYFIGIYSYGNDFT